MKTLFVSAINTKSNFFTAILFVALFASMADANVILLTPKTSEIHQIALAIPFICLLIGAAWIITLVQLGEFPTPAKENTEINVQEETLVEEKQPAIEIEYHQEVPELVLN